MNVSILEKKIELENKKEAIARLFDEINKEENEGIYNFSYMIVDGVDVFNDFEIYLEDNISYIEEIEVIMLTVKELVKENLKTVNDYIKNTKTQVIKLSDEFYTELKPESWLKLVDLFEGMDWIIESFKKVDSMKNVGDIASDYEIWNNYAKTICSMNETLKEFEEAIVNKDSMLIADLLIYGVVSEFENMSKDLECLIIEN